MNDRVIPTCKGPDPGTRTPRTKVPAGACDAHCHIFGPGAVFPYSENRAYTPPDAPYEALVNLHRILGLERAVIVHASCHGSDMRVTLDGIARAGQNRMRGVCVVNPGVTDADLRALDEGGIRGVRFNFVRHHMGRVKATAGTEQPAFQALLGLMRNPLSHVKICGMERVSSAGSPFRDALPFARALAALAPDRVLWGTDWPHPNIAGDMPNDGDLLDLLNDALDGDATMLRRVLVDNPNCLYWPEESRA
jgi:predicted TIM-barrel fold metal-dependent hydrolase